MGPLLVKRGTKGGTLAPIAEYVNILIYLGVALFIGVAALELG